MDADFWHQKWENADIAFHKDEPNPLLLKYFKTLSLAKGSRIFLPLCGKTLDISWFLSRGYSVAGAELSKIAVEQLFDQLALKPEKTQVGSLVRYSERNIDIFVGDLFDLSADLLGSTQAVYDRAALVALPLTIRKQYAQHLITLTNSAPQLLVCFEYKQSKMAGPPFSVSDQEVTQLYGDSYNLKRLESSSIPGGLKGKVTAKENVWTSVSKIP